MPQGLKRTKSKQDRTLTIRIRDDLHMQLKIVAAKRRTTMGELIEIMIERYVKAPLKGAKK